MSDLQSKTPITDAAEKASAESIKNEAYRSEGRAKHSNNGWKHARALELAANGLRDALSARQWVQYVDAEGEVWAACSDCLQSPEEGHAPACETATALANLATLTK